MPLTEKLRGDIFRCVQGQQTNYLDVRSRLILLDIHRLFKIAFPSNITSFVTLTLAGNIYNYY